MDFADKVERLRCIRDGMGDLYSNDEILAVGLAEYPGPVSNAVLAQEADLRLVELLEDPMAL